MLIKSNMPLFILFCLCGSMVFAQKNVQTADICVYGGTAAGVVAAYTAKQMGRSVILIEAGKHIGGLTSGGLGYTDIGNKYVVSGISRDFYRRVGKHYGKFEQWIFEPHVAKATLMQYITAAKVNVLYEHEVITVKKETAHIREITLRYTGPNGKQADQTIKARMFIDCSYEGDLMAKAGVSYIVGREANSVYNETYNGVQLMDKHQFPDDIDPYVIPGDPKSGLLWGISGKALAERGTGDSKVQAYNYRLCLTNEPANSIPITKPDDYDASKYELLLRVIEKNKSASLNPHLKIDLMPNHKTDINNNGPFSTDMIGMNYDYAEADFTTRQKIAKAHESYTKGLLYFLGNDERVPVHLRQEMLQWGYPKDEYTDNGNFTPQMYIREARRMIGAYVMTQDNCEGKRTVADGVGMAAYTMDSHNCQRIVVNGMVKNEGDVQVRGGGPYPVAYRSIIPQPGECKNLLVPVCLSASHIAYGSIRMEPVFMVLAQSAAVAASMAIQSGKAVQDVDVKKLQQSLQANPLMNSAAPEILVDNDDTAHVTIDGKWEAVTQGAYGSSKLRNADNSVRQSVRFTPTIVKAGGYKIYYYLTTSEKPSTSTQVKIFNGQTIKSVPVSSAELKVEGQTSGGWIDLGAYRLPAGKKGYVEITNEGADGIVIADAVLFIPE
ncbi:FAD-dependent oxidoreductase [Agriterribacter sp.]|uniref:FAD-dependent oxidoreductase n=1 Tax=Agriterribacter sp. TaxID=2821509 RepID=UPI002BE9FDF7|nr:FAD-dependent oxidoreductase [Agriterribacter sp.]HRO47103.1 FAD-dependent oxidoreductase [Agriterribacter sp.]